VIFRNALFLVSIAFFYLGCSVESSEYQLDKEGWGRNESVVNTVVLAEFNDQDLEDTIATKIIAAGLVKVQSINPAIRVELKYATTDNFMNTNVYGGFKDAYLQPEVAERLGKVQDYLLENHPEYSLLIYDAVRPRSVQQFMWDLLDSIPVNQRAKFVSNPKNGSLHSYGCAVDVTLWKEGDGPVDMGAGYDDMRKIAYPEFESHFLSTGELTSEQYANRQLLRKAMRQGGFWVIQTEWWHFNAHSRDTAKKLYDIVE
jgi:D-alanyl-D-alanine dipeptidase